MTLWQSSLSIDSSGIQPKRRETRKIMASRSSKLQLFFSMRGCCRNLTKNTVTRKNVGSVGLDKSTRLLVVCHTFRQITQQSASIRIFSARKATRRETKDYEKRKP